MNTRTIFWAFSLDLLFRKIGEEHEYAIEPFEGIEPSEALKTSKAIETAVGPKASSVAYNWQAY